MKDVERVLFVKVVFHVVSAARALNVRCGSSDKTKQWSFTQIVVDIRKIIILWFTCSEEIMLRRSKTLTT